MDSRATLREIFFRFKLATIIALIGALAGAIVYLLYITYGYNYNLQRYLWLLEKILTDNEFVVFRRDIMLAAVAGALLATLPVNYIYTR